jgi:hypothetical protein
LRKTEENMKFLLHIISFFFVFDSFSQKTISLSTNTKNYIKNFSIVSVEDVRQQRDNIGTIFVSATQKETISLKGGTISAVKKLFSQAILPKNQTFISISYKILEIKILESRLPNGNVSGQMLLRVAFDRIGKKDTVMLTETTTSTSFLRSDDKMPDDKYEPILTSLFTKSLEYFDKWLVLNEGRHEALIKGVKIIFLPETDRNDNDTIYYETRKVNWDDFRGKPTNSIYGAAIFANFAYTATFRIVDSYIEARIQAKTYMVRGMSWVTPASYSDYALAHEQLHFDIAKLVTERFKKKIVAMKADLVIDLNSMIQYEYLESYREMNLLQKQYDGETQHSINTRMQAEWGIKVREWLKEVNK